jgi:Zn-dependent protease with chaperone function
MSELALYRPAMSGAAPADRFRWMYLLVIASLMAIGAGAGQAAAAASSGHAVATVQTCLHEPAEARPGETRENANERVVLTCLAPLSHRTGLAIGFGAVAVPALAWILMLGSGFRLRRRLARSGGVVYRSDLLTVLSDRFGHWCDAAGLTGRHRPDLLIGRPGGITAGAFTTALPFSRATVVIPAGYAYTDPAQLDAVLLHELAHVRNRDVTWASAIWWTGWLNVPVLLFAFAPLIEHPGRARPYFADSVLMAIALSLATLAFRAGALRSREHAADRFAVTMTGHEEALATAAALHPVQVRDEGHGPAERWRRLARSLSRRAAGWAAVHPDPGSRVTASKQVLNSWERGFAMAAATGLIAMFGYQLTSTFLDGMGASGLADRWLSDVESSNGWTSAVGRAGGPEWSSGLTGLPKGAGWSDLRTVYFASLAAMILWALVLVPVWARHFREDSGDEDVSRPDRSGPRARGAALAGSTVGLTIGAFLIPPGAQIGVTSVWFEGHVPLAVAGIALLTAGIGSVGMGLATAAGLGTGRRRVAGLVAAIAGAVGTGATVLCLGIVLLGLFLDRASPVLARFLILMGGSGDVVFIWTPGALVLCAVVLALVNQRRARPKSLRWNDPVVSAVLAGLAAGTAIATLAVRVHVGHTSGDDAKMLLASSRWWICAMAGFATMTVISVWLRRGFVPALIGGAVTTLGCGLGQFARDAAFTTDGSGRNLSNLVSFLRTPLWLLFVAVLLLRPALMLLVDRLPTALVHARARQPLPGAMPVALLTACAVGLVTLPIVSGVTAPLTASPGDARIALKTLFGAEPAPDPGRVVSTPQAVSMLAELQRTTLAKWSPGANDPVPDYSTIQPSSCRELFVHEHASELARRHSADETRTYVVPAADLPPAGARLVISLTSYQDPAAAKAALQQWHTDLERCPDFTLPLSAGSRPGIVSLRADGSAADSAITYPAELSMLLVRQPRAKALGDIFSSTAEGAVLVGHNLISAAVTYTYVGQPTDSVKEIIDVTREHRQTALLAIIAQLTALKT